MKEPIQEDLLGYVLGALDADQHDAVEQRIAEDPQLDEQLLEIKAQLAPLELVSDSTGSRPGLARRTVEMVASEIHTADLPETQVVARSQMAIHEPLQTNSTWSMKDFLVAAASLAIVASLLFPAIVYAKRQSSIAHCGNNLRSIGMAFASFSENNNGRFVEVPANGPLAFAGIFAPILKEADVVEDDSWFTCRAVDRDQPFMIPSTDQIRRCSTGAEGDRFRRISSGDYAYSFGHLDGDKYVSPRNLGRSYRVIAADKPSTVSIGGPSDNHGGHGQNCLFEDFSVKYVKGNSYGSDPIYLNAQNVVAPGIGARDSVIGASHLSPLQAVAATRINIAD